MKVFNQEPVFQKTDIKNSVSLITEHHPGSRLISVGVFIPYGSCHEKKQENGLAHLLEHMVFKKTQNYSSLEINQKIEGLGGELNAFTTKEFTCLHATLLSEHLSQALEILSELCEKAIFLDEDLEKEKDVILQEIDNEKDDPELIIYNSYFEKTYKSHPLGLPILGTEDSLSSLSLKDIQNAYDKEYQNVLISVAGHVDHSEALKLTKNFFKRQNTSKDIQKLQPSNPRVFDDNIDSSFQQAHLLMGFEAPNFCDNKRFSAHLLATILGSGMSSRLYQKLREKEALVYSVSSHLNQTQDSGQLLIASATSKEHLPKTRSLIEKELQDLKTTGVSRNEFEFFKNLLIGELVILSDDIEQRMETIACHVLYHGKYQKVQKSLQMLEDITQDDFGNFCEETIQNISYLTLTPR